MKIKLINEPNRSFSATQQVLFNRGITNTFEYLNVSEKNLNPPEALGEENLKRGLKILFQHITNSDDILLLVDADNDGYTSSALFANYLYKTFPAFVQEHLKFFFHDGKQHGLNDVIDIAKKYKMVICIDSSSNDYEEHKILYDNKTDVLVLDHHEADKISEYACVINNQLCDYPNKELSGVGIAYQFCRYIDKMLNKNYADDFLDLVASGLTGDMMSMKSLETKYLIFKGFKKENIKNPFILNMCTKNNFSLNKADYRPSENNDLFITPMGAAFFLIPYVNAIVRSGNLEEKITVFNSMLDFKANELVPSIKRGHAEGEIETIIEQAIRICTNVKNRQQKSVDHIVELLEKQIIDNDMMKHKVLLFLLEQGEVDKNVAGLAANKFMSKYQRPVAILTRCVDENGDVAFQGSARGYGDEMDFRNICLSTECCKFCSGHANAFGLSLYGDNVESFLSRTDEALSELSAEPSYFVDYIWTIDNIEPEKIIDIAEMNDYWGKDLDRAYICLKNIPVNQDNFKVMKSNTLKFEYSPVDIIKFKGEDEEVELFNKPTTTYINAVCKCTINEFNGMVNPQLILVDYEISKDFKPNIMQAWNF